MGRNSLLVTAFFLGLVIDFFSYTLGFNMLACTMMGFSRYYVINVFAPRDMADSSVPSVETFGAPLFIRYAAVLALIHHVVFFIAESSTFFNFPNLLLKITGSFVLTILLIRGTEQLKLGF